MNSLLFCICDIPFKGLHHSHGTFFKLCRLFDLFCLPLLWDFSLFGRYLLTSGDVIRVGLLHIEVCVYLAPGADGGLILMHNHTVCISNHFWSEC